MNRWRPRTIRARLTLWHGGLFFLGGLLLLLLTTGLLVWSEWTDRQATIDIGRAAGLSEEQLSGDDPIGEIRAATTINGVPYDDLVAEAGSTDVDGGIDDLFNFSLVSLAVLTVIASSFGFWSSGRMLRPVASVTAAAKGISETNLSERLDFDGPQDELKDLADTFDGMLDRLERAFLAQGDFISNASHELRTPLAIMKTELDVNLADPTITDEERAASVAALRQAVDRSELVIDRLLVLAGSDTIHDRTVTDLAEIAHGTIEHLAPRTRAAHLDLTHDLRAAPVMADAALLTQLMDNLVQNAIVHNRGDGWITVATSVAGDEAVVTVSNSGDVIDPTECARLFDRFYRRSATAVQRVRGIGLGLPIVRSIAEAHGGRVRAEPLAAGGLSVTVALPAIEP